MMRLRVNIIRRLNVIENDFWMDLPRGLLGFMLRRIEIRFFIVERITFVVISFNFCVHGFLLRRMMFRKRAKHRDRRAIPHELQMSTDNRVVFYFANAIHFTTRIIGERHADHNVLLRHSFVMYSY